MFNILYAAEDSKFILLYSFIVKYWTYHKIFQKLWKQISKCQLNAFFWINMYRKIICHMKIILKVERCRIWKKSSLQKKLCHSKSCNVTLQYSSDTSFVNPKVKIELIFLTQMKLEKNWNAFGTLPIFLIKFIVSSLRCN